jgi:hypothetical protein
VFQALSGDKASGKCGIFADGFAGIEIAATMRVGVMHPKNYRAPVPPMGGAQLKADQVTTVATYIWAFGQRPLRRFGVVKSHAAAGRIAFGG